MAQECWQLRITYRLDSRRVSFGFFFDVDHTSASDEATLTQEMTDALNTFLGWCQNLRAATSNTVVISGWKWQRVFPTRSTNWDQTQTMQGFFGLDPLPTGSDKFVVAMRWIGMGVAIRQSVTRFPFIADFQLDADEISGALRTVLTNFYGQHTSIKTLASGDTIQGCLYSPTAGIVPIIGFTIYDNTRPKRTRSFAKREES